MNIKQLPLALLTTFSIVAPPLLGCSTATSEPTLGSKVDPSSGSEENESQVLFEEDCFKARPLDRGLALDTDTFWQFASLEAEVFVKRGDGKLHTEIPATRLWGCPNTVASRAGDGTPSVDVIHRAIYEEYFYYTFEEANGDLVGEDEDSSARGVLITLGGEDEEKLFLHLFRARQDAENTHLVVMNGAGDSATYWDRAAVSGLVENQQLVTDLYRLIPQTDGLPATPEQIANSPAVVHYGSALDVDDRSLFVR